MSDTPLFGPTPSAPGTSHKELQSKQSVVMNQIANQQNHSLVRILLSVPSGWLLKRKHRAPLSVWYQIVTSFAFLFSVVLIFELLFGDLRQTTNIGISRGWIDLFAISVSSLVVIVGVRINSIHLDTLRESVLNSIQHEEDLVHFSQWMLTRLGLRKQVISALPWAILLCTVSLLFMSTLGITIDLASMIVMVLYAVYVASIVPAVSDFFAMLAQLTHYCLRIYPIDPSSSKVIVSLSKSVGSILLLLGAVTAFSTLLSFLLGLLNTLYYILAFTIPWVVSISFFTIGHYALAKIIFQTKQQRLDEIQAKIEQIEREQDITNKETMEAINRLADYHNRIKGTRNSAIDIGTLLRFLQSLLLPLIASLLGSIGQIIQLLSP